MKKTNFLEYRSSITPLTYCGWNWVGLSCRCFCQTSCHSINTKLMEMPGLRLGAVIKWNYSRRNHVVWESCHFPYTSDHGAPMHAQTGAFGGFFCHLYTQHAVRRFFEALPQMVTTFLVAHVRPFNMDCWLPSKNKQGY